MARIAIREAELHSEKPDICKAVSDEAIQWYLAAANQGFKPAQIDLGREYQKGRFVMKDVAEAYKWFVLASKTNNLLDAAMMEGKSSRDALVAQMTPEEIAEGNSRVSGFVPRQASTKELPDAWWAKEIKLQGVGVTEGGHFAIINGKTMAKGETDFLRLRTKYVRVRCVEIREASAVVEIGSLEGLRELQLSRNSK